MSPVDIGIRFTKKPLVTKLDNGLYVALADTGYDTTGLYSCISILYAENNK